MSQAATAKAPKLFIYDNKRGLPKFEISGATKPVLNPTLSLAFIQWQLVQHPFSVFKAILECDVVQTALAKTDSLESFNDTSKTTMKQKRIAFARWLRDHTNVDEVVSVLKVVKVKLREADEMAFEAWCEAPTETFHYASLGLTISLTQNVTDAISKIPKGKSSLADLRTKISEVESPKFDINAEVVFVHEFGTTPEGRLAHLNEAIQILNKAATKTGYTFQQIKMPYTLSQMPKIKPRYPKHH